MDPDQARSFVAGNHRAVLATTRSDGRAQMSPVVCALDQAGRVVISSRETAMKVRNARRRPAVSLCVMSDGFYGPWVQVDGRADVLPLPDAMEGLIDQYRQVAGEHPDWDDFRSAMRRERRVLLRMEIRRAGPDRRS